MTPRILFLNHVGALGGAELTLIDIVQAFRATSTVVLFEDGPLRAQLTDAGVQVEVVDAGPALKAVRRETRWPRPRVAWDVLKLARRIAPLARKHDFIVANSQKALVVASLVRVLTERQVVWDLNDLLIREHFSRLNIAVDVVLARLFATRVLANSQATAHAFVARGGPAAKTRVVYDGIDPAPFDAVTAEDVAQARHELGIGHGPVVGVFGRLAEWKGQRVALEAIRTLPGVHLLLVGDALFGEEAFARRLRRYADALGIEDRVTFTGFRSDIPRLMRLVDIVMHTSTAPEPFGRVIVEGMLAQRPVIATRGGGVDEIIESPEMGVLVNPGNAAELAAAISRLLQDPVAMREQAITANRMARERFALTTMVSDMEIQMQEVARR